VEDVTGEGGEWRRGGGRGRRKGREGAGIKGGEGRERPGLGDVALLGRVYVEHVERVEDGLLLEHVRRPRLQPVLDLPPAAFTL
jgi:hypothetical protein